MDINNLEGQLGKFSASSNDALKELIGISIRNQVYLRTILDLMLPRGIENDEDDNFHKEVWENISKSERELLAAVIQRIGK